VYHATFISETDSAVLLFHFYRATACNATHGIAMGKVSVCPSVRQTNGLSQNKRKFCPHSYTMWKIIHFSDKMNGWWVDPFYLKFRGKLSPLERKRRLSINIRL